MSESLDGFRVAATRQNVGRLAKRLEPPAAFGGAPPGFAGGASGPVKAPAATIAADSSAQVIIQLFADPVSRSAVAAIFSTDHPQH
jgi:hypothetical protein